MVGFLRQPVLIKNEQLTGFVVTRAFAGDNNLKAGDIILELMDSWLAAIICGIILSAISVN